MRTIREIFRQSEERVGQEEGEARDEAEGLEMERGGPEVGQRRRPEHEAGRGGVQGEAEEGDPLRGRRGESGAGEEVTETEPCTEVASVGTCGRTPTRKCATCNQPRCRVHLTRCSDARCVQAQGSQEAQQSVPKPRPQQKKKKAKGAGSATRTGGKH